MVIDILKGILTMFYNPIFYLLWIGLVLFGYQRVRRERISFGIKVFGMFNNVFACFGPSLIMGAGATVVLLVTGIALPVGVIALLSACYLLIMLSTQLRYLSPSIAAGAAIIIAFIFPDIHTGMTTIDHWIDDIRHVSFVAFGTFFMLSLLVECLLVYIWGGQQISPRLINSKRGKKAGAHEASKLWIVPLFFLVPMNGSVGHAGWWPLSNGFDFGFVLFPLGVGLQQLITHKLPKSAVRDTGHWLLITTIATGVLVGVAAYFDLDVIVILGAVIALLSRLCLVIYHYYLLDYKPLYFQEAAEGLKVVGIIPNSPADRMHIKPGEVVWRVNDQSFRTETEFYFALQQNVAYCKLQIIDHCGESRFVKGSIHQGDYHKIGLLFLEPAKRNQYVKAK
ncbi:PDZ domain-containing protein [Scopulibacillus darangshiensis]|nr:PDZ domain-containing protein [Scopulibacillus darangshiensis]